MKYKIKIAGICLAFIAGGIIMLAPSQSDATTLVEQVQDCNPPPFAAYDASGAGAGEQPQQQDPQGSTPRGGKRLLNNQKGHETHACTLVSDTNGVFDGKLIPEELKNRTDYFKEYARCMKLAGCYVIDDPDRKPGTRTVGCAQTRCKCHKDLLKTRVRCVSSAVSGSDLDSIRQTGNELRKTCRYLKRILEKGGSLTVDFDGHSREVKEIEHCPRSKKDVMRFKVYENSLKGSPVLDVYLYENKLATASMTTPDGGVLLDTRSVDSFIALEPR